jgi:hypothetical protein
MQEQAGDRSRRLSLEEDPALAARSQRLAGRAAPSARRGPRIDSRRVENVSTVFELTSAVWTPCPVCRAAVGPMSADSAALDERVTHLLTEHKATLLHVGQESSTDADGNPWQMTVAVVGR